VRHLLADRTPQHRDRRQLPRERLLAPYPCREHAIHQRQESGHQGRELEGTQRSSLLVLIAAICPRFDDQLSRVIELQGGQKSDRYPGPRTHIQVCIPTEIAEPLTNQLVRGVIFVQDVLENTARSSTVPIFHSSNR